MSKRIWIIAAATLLAAFTVGTASAGVTPANGRIWFQRQPFAIGQDGYWSVEPDGTDPQLAFELVSQYWQTTYRDALSPDGTRLLLAQNHESSSGGTQRSRLIEVDAADGGNPSVVLSADDSYFGSVSYYPDGSRILFTKAFFDRPDTRYQLYSALLDGSDITRIGARTKFDAVMSPDLTTIAFVGRHGKLVLIDEDGSDRRVLLPGGGAYQPAWSPDGMTIAFAKGSDIFRIGADGSGRTRLTDNGAYEGSPLWSPDGERIVFERVNGAFTESDLFTIAANGSGEERVTDDVDFEFLAGWAPA